MLGLKGFIHEIMANINHYWNIQQQAPNLCIIQSTVYPKKYAHGFCFAVLCWGYTLTDFPISIRLTSLALWQSNDCPSASKATLMNMDKYFMWIHYERLHNHNKAKHNKTVCIFLGIYCMCCMEHAPFSLGVISYYKDMMNNQWHCNVIFLSTIFCVKPSINSSIYLFVCLELSALWHYYELISP